MRENVIMECTSCKSRNYMTAMETKGGRKLEMMKFCKKERKHTLHRARKK